MSDITERQQYWRDHILAADTFDGTIVEYAKAHQLKTKDLYQWKTSLTKRGFLPHSEQPIATDFVAINVVEPINPVEPSKPSKPNSVQCRLTLPCGSVLEYFTPVEPASLSRLLQAVRTG